MVCFKTNSKQKSTCCICYDLCTPVIKCRFCVEGIICSDCTISSCEHGINDRCPCCRREKKDGLDWKKYLIKSTKICPIGKSKVKHIVIIVVQSNDIKKKACKCCDEVIRQTCDIYKLITCIIGLILILWIMGFITILLFSPILIDDKKEPIYIMLFVPIVIGLIEAVLCKCCCCANFDLRRTFCPDN